MILYSNFKYFTFKGGEKLINKKSMYPLKGYGKDLVEVVLTHIYEKQLLRMKNTVCSKEILRRRLITIRQ
jgi:hypothetical protein